MIYQVDETREKILREAEKLFRERGFFETQMKDIAEKTGMSRNTVYRYYRDKSDLAMTIIENRLDCQYEKLQSRFDEIFTSRNLSGLDKLEKLIRTIWIEGEDVMDGKLMAEFDAFYSGSRLTDEMKKKFILFESDEYISSITKIIDEGKEDGSIRKDIDSHLAFVTILNGVRALSQRIILRGDVLVETTEGETDQMPALLLDLLIEGLRNRSKT